MHLVDLFIFRKIFDNIGCLKESRRAALEKLALILAASLRKYFTTHLQRCITSYQENTKLNYNETFLTYQTGKDQFVEINTHTVLVRLEIGVSSLEGTYLGSFLSSTLDCHLFLYNKV